MKNSLYYGDNLEVLRKHIRDETVDLVYIDPPFNSKRNYNQIYNNIGREEDRAQAQAFVDTWTWDAHANDCFKQILSNENRVQTQQSIKLISHSSLCYIQSRKLRNMPMKSKKSTAARNGKTVKRDGIRSAANALSQRDVARSSCNGKSSPRRAELSADDLALRAWKTTYKNRRTSVE